MRGADGPDVATALGHKRPDLARRHKPHPSGQAERAAPRGLQCRFCGRRLQNDLRGAVMERARRRAELGRQLGDS